MSTVFVVTQEGVYRHRIAGVFMDQTQALIAGNRAIREERDDYHRYKVVAFDLDVYVAGEASDGEVVATFTRDDRYNPPGGRVSGILSTRVTVTMADGQVLETLP